MMCPGICGQGKGLKKQAFHGMQKKRNTTEKKRHNKHLTCFFWKKGNYKKVSFFIIIIYHCHTTRVIEYILCFTEHGEQKGLLTYLNGEPPGCHDTCRYLYRAKSTTVHTVL